MEEQTRKPIKEINISNEMRTSFLNYAMSVIVSRALPDVRDGLKPVHRRILYGMNNLGLTPGSAYKKSARITGEVMGKYHPHGDSSIYEAMVRMGQEFSYRYQLVDGQGNFGSIDGDEPAAMRYTEARMSKISLEMLRDLNKNTVDFIDNYDATEQEPAVLPSRFPNILVNGTTGIAVGMATNIPPHNLKEIIDGTIAVINNPEITTEELFNYVKGPDFPTGGQLLGVSGLRQAYETGNGTVVIRSKTEIIENSQNGKSSIIVKEIPYQVNKKRLIERIAEVVKNKTIEGITDLRDESNRKGIKIVIELRKDINPYVMLNNLYKHTQLQVSYGINFLALVDNKPRVLGLKAILVEYIKHQLEVITRRTIFDLEKAEARIHILEGLIIALNSIDEVIALIKQSENSEKAINGLMEKFGLSEIQSKNILDMKLQKLTGIEISKIKEEKEQIEQLVQELNRILNDENHKKEILIEELTEISDKYGDERKTTINLHEDVSIENEDLIPVDDVLITITNNGYAKRMKVENYKAQNRGGTGLTGIKTNQDDQVEFSLTTSTHDYLLFFSNKGRVYKIKGYQIPECSRTSKGIPIVNMIPFQEDEKMAAFTNIKDFNSGYLFFVTKKGIVKRTAVESFKNIRQTGIIAISLKDDDELLKVALTDGNKDILLGASNGKAIRFKETDVRDMGRNASGVRGMSLKDDEYLVGMTLSDESTEKQEILVVTNKGFGKRSYIDEYRLQTRGGKGVKALNLTEKNGKLSTIMTVNEEDDLIITTNKGVSIRMHIEDITRTSRATQGVKLIRLREDQQVSTVITTLKEVEEESEIINEEL